MEMFVAKEVPFDLSTVRRPAPQDLEVYTAAQSLLTASILTDERLGVAGGDPTQFTLAGATFDAAGTGSATDFDNILPQTSQVSEAALETQDRATTGGTGTPMPTDLFSLASLSYQNELLERQRRIMQKALSGDTNFDLDLQTFHVSDPREAARAVLKSQGIDNPTEHNLDVAVAQMKSGASAEQVASAVRSDPIVFDLNDNGNTDATETQDGIEVDGSTHTAWAQKGDGVLSFGDHPIDTMASDGSLHANAYETLAHEAKLAGIDTSKGYLDEADIKVLESKGMTMMVSKGEGQNDIVKPSELGITKMSLGGVKVDRADGTGKSIIDTQGTFERNGTTHIANDMWFADTSKK